MSTGQGVLGCNMYCYCLNNPVNMVDESGEFAITISATAVVSIVGIVALLLTADYAINREKSLIGILSVQITSLYTSISSIEFSTSVSDPFARPGQKKQNRERKEKNARAKIGMIVQASEGSRHEKKHTPGKEHRKYNTLFGGEYECLD